MENQISLLDIRNNRRKKLAEAIVNEESGYSMNRTNQLKKGQGSLFQKGDALAGHTYESIKTEMNAGSTSIPVDTKVSVLMDDDPPTLIKGRITHVFPGVGNGEGVAGLYIDEPSDYAVGNVLNIFPEDKITVLESLKKEEQRDIVFDIMKWEIGGMDDAEMISFFSRLVKTGTIQGLQGTYQRAFRMLVDNGFLDEAGNILKLEALNFKIDMASFKNEEAPSLTRAEWTAWLLNFTRTFNREMSWSDGDIAVRQWVKKQAEAKFTNLTEAEMSQMVNNLILYILGEPNSISKMLGESNKNS